MLPRLEVFDSSAGNDLFVGEARFTLRRGALSTTFLYANDYLANKRAYQIDPALPLVAGPLHVPGIPGVFRDSSPDRWGRHLIAREQQLETQSAKAPSRQLDEVDFLIGVLDLTREGSLRFRTGESDFLASAGAIPPMIRLPELADAARKACEDNAGQSQLKELLDAGSSSLGGARPKASVIDGKRLLLAKFSHPADEWDVMAWEKTALDLAEVAGIAVPQSQLVRIGGESVLLLERFDREKSSVSGGRIPYQSAMTALQSLDGETHDYAELAETVAFITNNTDDQLAELFRRVVFYIGIGNTDDHLRNWGFLRQNGSWMLSPMFDVNPNPYREAQRMTGVAGRFGSDAYEGLADLAIYAGLNAEHANSIMKEVSTVLAQWQTFARKNGCTSREIKLFAPAFTRLAQCLA